MSKHEVRWYDSTGSLQDVITAFTRLNYVKTANKIGAMELILPKGKYEFSDFTTDVVFEVWREVNGVMQLQGETAYFLLDWEMYEANRHKMIRLLAKDANFLLSTRIVAYKAGTSEAEKDDYADDMMKEIVKENIGTDADTDRQMSNFTIDGEASASEEIEKAFAWRNVFDVCREISELATDKGTRTYFEVVRATPGNYTFKTWTSYRGSDHGASSGDVRFVGMDYGNLKNARVIESHSNQKSSLVIGGQGVESDRDTVSYAPTESGYYRNMEVFVDARDISDSDQLDDLKYEKYDEYNYKVTVTGELSETPGMRYGIDYNFGDVLAVEAFGHYVDCRADSVAIQADANGNSIISVHLEGELE